MTTTTSNVRAKIFYPHNDLSDVHKCTDNATDAYSAISSQPGRSREHGYSNTETLKSIPRMYSTASFPLHPGMLRMDGSRPTPQKKRKASNSMGLFRPFDSPPKKIQKLSTDSNNNNIDLFTDADSSSEGDSDVYQRDVMRVLKSSTHKSTVKPSIFRTIDQLAISCQSRTYTAPVKKAMEHYFLPRDNFCTSTPLTSHRKIKTSPLRLPVKTLTFDVHETFWNQNQCFGTPTNIFATNPNQNQGFGTHTNIFATNPIQNKCFGTPINPIQNPCFGTPTNIIATNPIQNQGFGTTTNIFATNPNHHTFSIEDTPPYTPAYVVRPKPHRLLEAPQASNIYGDEYGIPSTIKFNDVLRSNVASQFNINGSYKSQEDFQIVHNKHVERATQNLPNQNASRISETDNSHNRFCTINSQTAKNRRSPLYFKMSRPTVSPGETTRSATITQDASVFTSFHSVENFLPSITDNVKTVSTVKCSTPEMTPQQERSDTKLLNSVTLATRFECRDCQKVFSQQRLLDRHVKRHGSVKGCICTFCNKGFSDAFDLKRHIRTHTGVRPFKCDDCGKAFTQRGSLELHTSNVHKRLLGYAFKERRNKVYVCEQCGHSEEQEKDYHTHLQLNHTVSFPLPKTSPQ